jgi:hypothetical protein
MGNHNVQHGLQIVGGIKLYQPRDRHFFDRYGDQIERRYIAVYESWKLYIPEIGDPHPVFDTAKFKSAEAEQMEQVGMLCEVTEKYITPAGGSTYLAIPADEYTYDVAGESISVKRLTNWDADIKQYWDFENDRFFQSAPAALQGMENYIVGGLTVSKTEYSNTYLDPELSSIGTKSSGPGGPIASAANQWLIVGQSGGTRGAFYTRTTVFKYSKTVLPALIYP